VEKSNLYRRYREGRRRLKGKQYLPGRHKDLQQVKKNGLRKISYVNKNKICFFFDKTLLDSLSDVMMSYIWYTYGIHIYSANLGNGCWCHL
jgi:hypothetical protein